MNNHDERIQFPFQSGFTLGDRTRWKCFFSHDLENWGKEFSTILGIQNNNKEPFSHGIFFITSRESQGETVQKLDELIKKYTNMCCDEIARFSLPGIEVLHCPETNCYLCHCLEPAEEERRTDKYLQMMSALFPLFNEALMKGGLPLHGALITHPETGGVSILAPGGKGKSTCSQRIPPPWGVLCDDLILVVKDAENHYLAHPLPTWSNFIFKRSLPLTSPVEKATVLKQLYFLQQSPQDEVERLDTPSAVQWIYTSSMQIMYSYIGTMQMSAQIPIRSRIFINAGEMAKQTSSFILKATLDGCFWKGMEQK